MRRTIAWAALVAWLGASGLSWDLLQVVAWVKMSAENARSMDVSSAVSKTLNDAPCSLCCAVKEGRESSDSSAPAGRTEQAKAKEKAQGSLWAASEAPEPIHAFAGLVPIPFRSHNGPLCEVPVPPPKSAA
jgi:hypothetical protein